jgi:glyoxylase-like metal-dependent hydrolase (beta-lactamase superfamily II)
VRALATVTGPILGRGALAGKRRAARGTPLPSGRRLRSRVGVRVNAWVERVPGALMANVFLVRTSARRRLLVDSSHPLERAQLLAGLRRLGVGPRDLEGVLLTHRHSDHAGNARFFQRHGVPVLCHRAEAPFLAGEARSRPIVAADGTAHARLAGWIGAVENRFPVRLHADRTFEHGEEVLGLEVRWMPGHTEGSVFFHHPDASTLFSGDTILAWLPPYRRGLALPDPTFSLDRAGALVGLRGFLAERPRFAALCAGHGRPLASGADDAVHAFLEGALAGSGTEHPP